VPDFLHVEFMRLGGKTDAELQAWYRALETAWAGHPDRRGPAQVLRSRFEEWVGRTPVAAARQARPSTPAPRLAATVWDRVLERLEAKIDRHQFRTWLAGTTLVEDRVGVVALDRCLVVLVPTLVPPRVDREALRQTLTEVLAALDDRGAARISVEFVTADELAHDAAADARAITAAAAGGAA
jgi:hypothetical protein